MFFFFFLNKENNETRHKKDSYLFYFAFFCSLRMMFESAQFKENFSLFQQLIVDGVFEMPSSSGAKLEDIRAFKKLALSDFNKSRLVESYNHLKVLLLTLIVTLTL